MLPQNKHDLMGSNPLYASKNSFDNPSLLCKYGILNKANPSFPPPNCFFFLNQLKIISPSTLKIVETQPFPPFKPL
jgi:hypothetical protein